ncbi:MAG: hypothetical protein AAFV49_04895, partial [Pseudomonadota bacterium]
PPRCNAEAPTFENTMLAMQQAGRDLGRISRVFFNLTSSASNDEIRAIQREMSPRLAAHSASITLNPALFARIDALYQARETLDLEPQEARLLELLGGGTDGREWLLSGGIATLQECGIDARALACSPDPGPWLATALREAFGARLGAIAGMAPSVRCGNLLLCSGGGEAGMRVEAQTRNALIFGPETDEAEILREDGLVVVHARPTGDGPGCGPQHIALDTGAAFSHQLAAARIATDGAVVFLDVDRASQD